MLTNRTEAGKKLAQKLQRYKSTDAVVLALPRGGVVVGHAVANILSLPLDIIATRKIGHPSNPEYAIGAVDVNGLTVFNEMEVSHLNKQWIKEEIRKQKEEARRRTKTYRRGRRNLDISGKTIIIVDDGIATGFTMRLAVKAVKKGNPEKIVVAVPVAPTESIDKIRNEGADEIVLLEPPEGFLGAVGAHYREFKQVEDEEVINLLNP